MSNQVNSSDTSCTKVFVGGLAWQTQDDSMKKYFEQFGEISEAVIITDKKTGRSKGYGFVTFNEPEAARKACVDATPVIDGRRTNCNLASLGVQRSRPSTPQLGSRGSFRAGSPLLLLHAGFPAGVGTAFPSLPTFPHYANQLGIPYNFYGYPPYSAGYKIPQEYYSIAQGGTTGQYPGVNYNGAPCGSITSGTTCYPYLQFGQIFGSAANTYAVGQDYAFPFPQQYHFHNCYSNGIPSGPLQNYSAPLTVPCPPPDTGMGVTSALANPALHTLAPHHQSHSNTLNPINSI